MKAIYLAGQPGAGKSSVMRRLLEPWDIGPPVRLTDRELFGHWMLGEGFEVGVYLGVLRDGPYPGTDALSMSVSPQARLWLEERQRWTGWVYGEGQRLFNQKFIAALAEACSEPPLVVLLTVDSEVAKQRWVDRKLDHLDFSYPASGDGEYKEKSQRQRRSAAENTFRRVADLNVQRLEIDTTRVSVDEVARQIQEAF